MLPPDDFDPPIGLPEEIATGLRRIVAPNPSPMTYRGTNTYLLGESQLAVIDPGPANDAHLRAILNAVGKGQQVTHIIVTHTHLDHSPLARPLSEHLGAPVYAFGDAAAGRSEVMEQLALSGMIGGGEGIDETFAPDETLADGDVLSGEGWTLEALHTPGHIGNHLCLAWGKGCFTADHVMGWASSLVSPPDGDLTDFMASCEKLAARDWDVFFPGHGAPVSEPDVRLKWLIAHRKGREAEILKALAQAPATAREIATQVYADTPQALIGAATRNVLAHLIDLMQKSTVSTAGDLHAEATFRSEI